MMTYVLHLMFFVALATAGCAATQSQVQSPRAEVQSLKSNVQSPAVIQAFGNGQALSVTPAGHLVYWQASADADTNVFYEVQHAPEVQNFSLFAYTTDTNVWTDPALPADFFRVRAVRNNGFHSSETSEWGHY